jgi:hemolysin III
MERDHYYTAIGFICYYQGMRLRFRDPFSGLSHLAAALLAAVGGIVLVIKTTGGLERRLPMIIYSISLVLLFGASATYHLIDGAPERIARLRRFDHSAIFLLIAGTYTPVAALVLTGPWRWGTLVVIWALALGGVISKVFTIGGPRWLYTVLYLLMGWLAVALIGQLWHTLPRGALAWMVAGGAVYTVGAILYIVKWPRLWPGVFGFHENWHLFVIGGAACHYVLYLVYLTSAV